MEQLAQLLPNESLPARPAAGRAAPAPAASDEPPDLRPHRRWPVAAGMALLLAFAAALAWRHWSVAPPPTYLTTPVTRGTVAPSITSSGTVNPVTTIQVGTYVSGVIESISCDFNTRVRAGQLCAAIDSRPYQVVVDQESAALGTARAQLEKDRSALDYAKVIHDRNTSLLARGIVSQETFDTSKSAYDQARTQIALDEASVAQHEAALKAARINLGYTRIVSPVDGTVVSRNVTQGQTVAASFQTPTLFLIATDLTQMQVDTNVSESDIGRVAEGNPATFTVESFPDRTFSGTVVQVRQAPQTVQNVVTYDVVLGVPNKDLVLKPGMTASVRIVTARADQVLRVPEQALRYAPSGASRARSPDAATGRAPRGARPARVWILRDGQPREVPVTTGLVDDTFVEVRGDDLHEGDAVIVGERAAGAGGTGAGTAPRMPRM